MGEKRPRELCERVTAEVKSDNLKGIGADIKWRKDLQCCKVIKEG